MLNALKKALVFATISTFALVLAAPVVYADDGLLVDDVVGCGLGNCGIGNCGGCGNWGGCGDWGGCGFEDCGCDIGNYWDCGGCGDSFWGGCGGCGFDRGDRIDALNDLRDARRDIRDAERDLIF